MKANKGRESIISSHVVCDFHSCVGCMNRSAVCDCVANNPRKNTDLRFRLVWMEERDYTSCRSSRSNGEGGMYRSGGRRVRRMGGKASGRF